MSRVPPPSHWSPKRLVQRVRIRHSLGYGAKESFAALRMTSPAVVLWTPSSRPYLRDGRTAPIPLVNATQSVDLLGTFSLDRMRPMRSHRAPLRAEGWGVLREQRWVPSWVR